MRTHELRLAPEKTEAVLLVRRKREPPPEIFVEDHPVNVQKSARYLGVHLQELLNGTVHVRTASQKAARAATDRILPRTYGATEGQRRTWATVAESIALYGSPYQNYIRCSYIRSCPNDSMAARGSGTLTNLSIQPHQGGNVRL